MSQDKINLETVQEAQAKVESSKIFSQIKDSDLSVSPYLKIRILAHMREHKTSRKKVLFWQFLSFGAIASIVFLAFLNLQMYQKIHLDAVTKQAYVIHIDFNQADQQQVVRAEVELPDNVHFVSSDKTLKPEKKMSLPITIKSLGRGKLPFVVASDSSGEKEIIVSLFNENEELVRKQVLKFKFAKNSDSVRL